VDSFGTNAPNGKKFSGEAFASRDVEHDLREYVLKGNQTVGGKTVRVAPNSMKNAGIPRSAELRFKAQVGSKEPNNFATRSSIKTLKQQVTP